MNERAYCFLSVQVCFFLYLHTILVQDKGTKIRRNVDQVITSQHGVTSQKNVILRQTRLGVNVQITCLRSKQQTISERFLLNAGQYWLSHHLGMHM